MPRITDVAIALRLVDFSETSQIVTLLAREHGLIRAIAKGIKRGTKDRVATPIDVLDVGRVVLFAGTDRTNQLCPLTEWKQTQGFASLRSRYDLILAGLYAAEAAGCLVQEWDPHPDLFDGLIGRLVELRPGRNPFEVLLGFQHMSLIAVGLMPVLDACVCCGRRQGLSHFSSFEGGMVCRNCEGSLTEKLEVRPEALRALVRIGASSSSSSSSPSSSSANDRFTTPPRHATDGATGLSASAYDGFTVFNYHISHILGRSLLLTDWLRRHRKAATK